MTATARLPCRLAAHERAKLDRIGSGPAIWQGCLSQEQCTARRAPNWSSVLRAGRGICTADGDLTLVLRAGLNRTCLSEDGWPKKRPVMLLVQNANDV